VFTLSVENQKHVSEVREGPIPVKMTSLVWVFLGIMSLLILVLVVAGAVARISTVCSRKRQAEKDARIINPSEKYLMYENKNNFSPINLQNNPDIIPDRERNRRVEMKRRNSYASESFNQPTEHRNNGSVQEEQTHVNAMYCTLPKNKNSRFIQTIKHSSQIPRAQLPTLFEQNSSIPREESSAEDLTLEGRVNRDEPAPAPPEFADTPPTPSSPFLQMMRGEEEALSLNTTRF